MKKTFIILTITLICTYYLQILLGVVLIAMIPFLENSSYITIIFIIGPIAIFIYTTPLLIYEHMRLSYFKKNEVVSNPRKLYGEILIGIILIFVSIYPVAGGYYQILLILLPLGILFIARGIIYYLFSRSQNKND